MRFCAQVSLREAARKRGSRSGTGRRCKGLGFVLQYGHESEEEVCIGVYPFAMATS